MKIIDWLDILYYDYNSQVDFSIQCSSLDGFRSKRTTYRTIRLDPYNKELWRLYKANNRTVLPCEICLDYDVKSKQVHLKSYMTDTDALKELYNHINNIVRIKKMFVYFSGSLGYHIHIFSNMLHQKEKNERKNIRIQVMELASKQFSNWCLNNNHKCISINIDKQLQSENVTIALENAPHWKTGVIKTMVMEI